jgi:fatty acid desaturase
MTDDALIRSTLFVLSLAGSFADRAARLDRPLLVGQGFLRPYLLAEHTACAFTRDCLENTRTTLTLWLVRLFAWNMPYHAEHHAYPAVPFHARPREASRGVAAGPR